MLSLISIELYKIFKKWRTYIGFIAIGLLAPLIHLSFYLAGERSATFAFRNLSDSFIFAGNLLNGYFISNLILQSLFVHIPFLVVLVGGDLLAGEATGGTYRMLVTRPVSRFEIITAKFIAAVIYTALLILWLAIMSLGLGLLIFGSGPLVAFKTKIIIFAANDVLWRFMAAYAFAILSMTVVITLAFLFSSLVENAIGPIVSTMAVIIIFFIISVIDIDFFNTIRPYLFTNHIAGWSYFFEDPVDYSKVLKDAGVLAIHIAVFYGAALYIFSKKDILS
ncbi:MAG: ABC transporter permease subunit [Ignavibacteria bacterium]|jgi:ABC-2 type transport system permease protein|nr:ABC transporter permease subunit [Ignavibacteria bacterium]MCU7504232.1 ABC transporter permease subunit [Ignavibacteria bacterium]MCU7516077.1 ABC transporter permease subunit [Ignavibacteria bacterium]